MADVITLIVDAVTLYLVNLIVGIVVPYLVGKVAPAWVGEVAPILVGLFAAVSPYLLDPIGREMFNYHSNIKKLSEEVNKLQAKKADWTNADEIDEIIKNALKFLEDEKKENEGFFNRLCAWLNLKSWYQKSRKAKQTAAEIVSKIQEGYQLPSSEIVPKIQEGYQLSSSCPPRKIRIPSVEGYEAFESRTPILKKIMESLSNANVNLIGVWGMGGTGKTMLVKEIGRKCEEDKLFDEVVIATVSQPLNIRKIQGEIADKLTLTLKEETDSGRAGRLCEELKKLLVDKKQSILVILDDIWEKLNLAEVGIPFGDNYRGCKVVMTSRNRDVLSNGMRTQETCSIDVLQEEEAWDLFKKIAGDSIEDHDRKPIARGIVEECARLPIAIVTVANALKNKGVPIWKDALRELRSTPTSIEGMQHKGYSALRWSYDFLEDEKEKSLFLLCSLLPEDYQFSILDILKFGEGVDLFQGINLLEDARNKVDKLLNTLTDSSLLLDDNTTRFRMHDIVRDVGIYVASNDKHMLIVRNDDEMEEQMRKEKLKDCPAISLPCSGIHELPTGLECPKLTLCLFFSNDRSLKIPDTFFERMEQLRVLNFRNMCFPSLPSSLRDHFLSNLRTLCLDHCVFRDIPRQDLARIGELKKLEVLSFASSDIAELPREIGQLTCLRLLDLTNCSKLNVILPNVIAKLTRLEDLYMAKSFDRWEVDGNASLAELKDLSQLVTLDIHIPDTNILPKDLRFENLMRYKIFIGDGWDWYGDCKTSRTLKLKLNTSIQEFGLYTLLERTEDLYLGEMNGIKNGLCNLNREGFPHLRHLHVQNGCEMEYVVNTLELIPDKAFPELRSLFLYNLIYLKKIFHGQLPTESFCKLRIVKVQCCDALKNLFPLSVVKGLLQLRTLKVNECKIMDEIVSEASEGSEGNNEAMGKITFPQLRSLELYMLPKLSSFYSKKQTSRPFNNYAPTTNAGSGEIISKDEHDIPVLLFNEKVAFPNLEKLVIENVNSLKEIWPSQLPVDDDSFCKLQSLRVRSCEHLLNIVPYNMLMRLQNMEILTVSNCGGSLEYIFDLGGLNDQGRHVELRDLELEEIPGLKQIWKKDPQTNFLCQKLSSLEVYRCGNLRIIFTTSMVKSLKQLQKLSISNCEMVEEIVEEEGVEEQATDKIEFPELTSLTLGFLPQLKSFCQGSCTLGTPTNQPLFLVDKVSFPNLEVLSIWNVNSLKEIWPSQLPIDDGSFCNLKSFYVDSCEHLLNIIPSNMLMRFQNMERLGVFGCGGSLECIFDLGGLNDEERHVELRDLNIRNLPGLKQIWKKDPQTNFLCQKLSSLEVSKCGNLRSIFTTSMVKSLKQLRDLSISECKMVEEIVEEEGVQEQAMDKIVFSQLTSLTLQDLPQLKSFCQGSHILEWPSSSGGDNLEIFALESSSFEEMRGKDHIGTPTEQPLLLVDKVAFPNLEELVIHGVKSLKEIWPSQLPVKDDSFCNLKSLCIKSCEHLLNIIPSNMLMRMRNLESLEVVWDIRSVEYIFDVGELNDMERHVLRSIPLRKLSLEDCPRLKQIWKTDFQLSGYFPFQNLTSLKVAYCSNLRHIFTTSIAKSLVQLQELSIWSCEMVEEIVGNEGVEEESMGKIEFPRLTSLDLSYLPQLKSFYQGILKVETFSLESSSIEESHGKGQVGIPTKALFLADKVAFPNLEELKLWSMSSMKEIWQDQYHASSFGKLRVLEVRNCESLRHVLTFAITKSLVQIESIIVDNCKMMKEVIASEEGKETDETAFTQLNSLELRNLSNLTSFCARSNSFFFPSLEEVLVEKCPELKTFSYGTLHTPKLDKVLVLSDLNTTIQCLFEQKVEFLRHFELSKLNKQICHDQFTVKDCYVRYLVVEKCTFLLKVFSSTMLERFFSNMLESIQKLEKIKVESCDSLEQVFELVGLNCDKERAEPLSDLEEMNLTEHPKGILCLRCIWNNDPKGILSFQYLRRLNIHKCNNLRNLFSCSMALDLQLEGLAITDCLNMEEIVNKEKGAMEEAIDKIVFRYSRYIILQGLPNLTSFYPGNHTLEFPSLSLMKIIRCPRIKTFTSIDVPSAPLFINNEVTFPNLEEFIVDSVSLKEIWHPQHPVGSFCKLKKLDVYSCNYLLNIVPSNMLTKLQNLESLTVMDMFTIDSLEYVFDLGGLNDKEKQIGRTTQLRDLGLRSLWKLKQIWKTDSQVTGYFPFQNLTSLNVIDCRNLRHIFTTSMAKSLVQLKELEIVGCWEMEEIVENEVVEAAATDKIVFPRVICLSLIQLEQLKSFCQGNRISEWPSLKRVLLNDCSDIEIFASELSSFEESQGKGKGHVGTPRKQPLFLVDKVAFPKLKELKLMDMCSLKEIWEGQFHAPSFCKLTTLEVRCCGSLTHLLPFAIAKSLVQLKSIFVRDCWMMTEIIASEEREKATDETIFSQLNSLKLKNLPDLTSIYAGSKSFSFPTLKEVLVEKCPKLNTFSTGLLNTPALEKVHIESEGLFGEEVVVVDKWVWKDDLTSTIRHLSLQKDSTNLE